MSETPATTWRARTEHLVTKPGRVYLVEASSDQHDQPIATAAVRLAEGVDPTRAAYLLRKALEEVAGDATLSVVAIPAADEETDWSRCGVSESSDDFEDDPDEEHRHQDYANDEDDGRDSMPRYNGAGEIVDYDGKPL